MNPASFTVRALFCGLVVFLTWNPTGVSYVHILRSGAASLPEAVAAGAALLAMHLFLLRSTFLALGLGGMALVLGVMMFAGLSVNEAGFPPAWRAAVMAYGPLMALAIIFTLGLSWSIIKRRLFGQSNTLNPPP